MNICERFKDKIYPKKEDYFQVNTYEKEKLVKIGFLHKKCNIQMSKEKEVIAKTFESIGKMSEKINDMVGLKEKPIEYEIKNE